jgi:hypothetical protein
LNDTDVIRMLALMSDLWTNFTPSETWPTTALEFLDDLPGRVVRLALQELAMTHPDFAPNLGLIRRTAVRIRGEQMGSGVPTLDEAWEEVQRKIREVGRQAGQRVWTADGQKVVRLRWSHEAIGRAVNALGWDTICDSTEPQVTFAQFRSIYTQGAERSTRTVEALPSRQKELTP